MAISSSHLGQNLSNKLSTEDLFITKAQTLPPLKKHVSDLGSAHTAPLMELFQVRIDKFDDIERRGELYGNIEVVDSEGSHTLYHQDQAKSDHIHANSTIPLMGPLHPISIVFGIACNIELYLRGESQDSVLSKWQLSWDALKPEVSTIARGKFLIDFCDRSDVLISETNCEHQHAGYDRPLEATFQGPNGCCLTMYYTLIEHAVQAWVKVEVVDVNCAPSVVEYNARGSIFAKYSHFENNNDSSIVEYCKTTLLKTNELKVERWKAIELSRWIVAVPAYSSLVIEADLWDTNSNLKIGEGKVEFNPSDAGFGADYIRGNDNFALRVMVCWGLGLTVLDNFPY